MALNSLSFLTIFALLVASFSLLNGVSAELGGRKALAPAPAPAAAPFPGDLGFTPLNSKDPEVVKLGEFAVDEYNKENKANLVFEGVLEAISTLVEQGTNYDVVVLASTDKLFDSYLTKIVVTKDNVHKLTSFAVSQ